ncbi:helix-turn-helix domain-containing protein [Flavobacterium sp. '19STA2R22 D10 B1']|uniref:helix-turn-helix domain-containing protein n=1 Tax=Flavobacterium aerium TaxID=3037261 RepID=UPI00278BDF33|nr:AraC family transcriptional regulator [Flavobacterium sp. '19STA2R22 D10 B1']
MSVPKKVFARQHEITADYLKELDKHLLDLLEGRVEIMLEIRDFAAILHIHPTHLTNTVKHATGQHPCTFYQDKIIAISKSLLEENKISISGIATLLTYDPSNFTKFFKKFVQMTPKQYRETFLIRNFTNTELVTK